MAAPWTAATTGSLASNSRVACWYRVLTPLSTGLGWRDRPARSAPAQKCLPAEHSTMARQSSRSSSQK